MRWRGSKGRKTLFGSLWPAHDAKRMQEDETFQIKHKTQSKVRPGAKRWLSVMLMGLMLFCRK